jgi:hypothetical protein
MDRGVMTFKACNTCGGVYPTTQADGLVYFHACAPAFDKATRLYSERPNKRDENVKTDPVTQKAVPIAAGAGAVDAAAPPAIQVPDAIAP